MHPWVAAGQEEVRFGIQGGGSGDWRELRDFVQAADELGFDAFFRPDHPMLTPDPWTLLGALAGATRRIRLGTSVSCVLYRNPAMLARVVADVDRISGGRVVLGLGSGDAEHEFRCMGLDYPAVENRQAALEEALQIIPPLLRGQPATFAGAHFQVREAALPFAAVQRPHVPILIGGGGARTTLRFVAQYGDASNLTPAPWGGGAYTAQDLARKYASLRRRCDEIGRPYESILRTMVFGPTALADTQAALEAKRARIPPPLLAFAGQAALLGTPEDAVARVRPFIQAGCQYVMWLVTGGDTDTLELLNERVIPNLRAARVPCASRQP